MFIIKKLIMRIAEFERPFFEISGKTMLISGLGAVGRQVALTANGFGMTVLGIQRNPNGPEEGVSELFTPADLNSALPLTPSTENFFGADQFAKMKKDSVFANMGRGCTVDTVHPEPLPADSALWNMPSVILSGHCAGMNQHYDERAFRIFLKHAECYSKGGVLPNLVDRTAGY